VTAKSLIVTPVWRLTVGVAPASKYASIGWLKMVNIDADKRAKKSGQGVNTRACNIWISHIYLHKVLRRRVDKICLTRDMLDYKAVACGNIGESGGAVGVVIAGQ
jgi:hypothetical protein